MALALYFAFLGAACIVALNDWRRGWMLVAVCGVLQDPARKLTSGSPVAVSFAVVGLYALILFAARNEIMEHLRDFARRFGSLHTATFVFLLLLGVSALNGLFTYGFDKWKVPLLSFITYAVPLVAILLGYTWLQREEMMYGFFRWYAALTSVALAGTLMEYLRVESRLLGMVGFEGDYIRHLPGIQIRLLSGFYRSPDIMAWHAATLTAIAVAMALRYGLDRRALIWSGLAGWGFFNCMIAGRRKAIYSVAVFAAVFLWRYFRRVKASQVFAMLGVAVILGGIVREIASTEKTSVYARGAVASQQEIATRLEGGFIETFRQFGLMGAGLGTATQGVRHLLGTNENVGWQEGGLGKLAIEVGLPGILGHRSDSRPDAAHTHAPPRRRRLVAVPPRHDVRARGGERRELHGLRAGVHRRRARADDRVLRRMSLRNRNARRAAREACARSGTLAAVDDACARVAPYASR